MMVMSGLPTTWIGYKRTEAARGIAKKKRDVSRVAWYFNINYNKF